MEGDPRAGHVQYRPAVANWNKSGVEYSARLRDWINCGGDADGELKSLNIMVTQKNFVTLANKQYDESQSCMINKGYQYVGSCRGASGLRFACKNNKSLVK